jgi:hypothetical protein
MTYFGPCEVVEASKTGRSSPETLKKEVVGEEVGNLE